MTNYRKNNLNLGALDCICVDIFEMDVHGGIALEA